MNFKRGLHMQTMTRFALVLGFALPLLCVSDIVNAQSLTTRLKEQIRDGRHRDELGGVPERFKSTANRRRVAARTDVPVTGSLPRTSTSSRRARTARERLANGPVPTSREGLWAYCRQRLFARYGWRDGSGKRFLWTDFSVQGTDACVRAGGIVR